MSALEAARKTVRKLSDRVADPPPRKHTMEYERQSDASGFLNQYDAWQYMKQQTDMPEEGRVLLLKIMQAHCVRHQILTADEVAAINTKYGVKL
jgi:hypothetical protein